MCIDWNAVSAIATAAATGVALCASFQAWRELKLNIKMQEKSKNVSLLDKRIKLMESIQSGKFVPDFVSEMTLEALFDNKIFAQYEKWKRHTEITKQIKDEMNEFDSKSRKSDGAGGFHTVRIAIEIGGADIEKCDFPRDVLDKYTDFCERIKAAEECEEKEKELLLQFMRKYTKESIESLNAKHKGKKGEQ